MKRTERDRQKAFLCMAKGKIATDVYERLVQEGFFTAPASANHHGNYEGGLYDHCEMVAITLQDLTERLDLKWKRTESPCIIGYLHDYCKVDAYIPDPEAAGKYQYNPAPILPGHGVKSVILTLRDMHLTNEEIMCIRYHMGAYEGEGIHRSLGEAIRKYPNIIWVHAADMLASQILEV